MTNENRQGGHKANAEFIFGDEWGEYTVIPNYIFDCKELSYRSIGIYCSILRFRNSNKHCITVKGLSTVHKEGRDAVSKAISELLSTGFLEKIENREKNGTFLGFSYKVYAKPIDTQSVHPITENPITENPITENPITENPQHKSKILKKQNSKNKNKRHTNTMTEIIYSYKYYFKRSPDASVAKQLQYYQERMQDELIVRSFDIAFQKNKAWCYARGVLKQWDDQGIKTVEDYLKI